MSYLVLFCSCVFSVLLALRLPRFGTRELILVLFVRLFDLCLFGFVGFLFSWCLGRAAVCDCDLPWTFLLPLFARSRVFIAFLFFSFLFSQVISRHYIPDKNTVQSTQVFSFARSCVLVFPREMVWLYILVRLMPNLFSFH